MGFPLLPQLSAAAELFIINLIAQHDPQPNAPFSISSALMLLGPQQHKDCECGSFFSPNKKAPF
jgi:hypothetical protein